MLRLNKKNTFTRADIQQWEQDLQKLPNEIQQLTANIKSHEQKLNQLTPELTSICAKIAPIDETIDALNARIEILESTAKIRELEAELPPHQAVIDKLSPELNEVMSKFNPITDKINELKKVIKAKELQLNIQRLQAEMGPLNTTLATLKPLHDAAYHNLQISNAEILQLNAQIRSLESQNGKDAAHLVMDSIVGHPAQPHPVAISPQPQPQPVGIGQPQPVPIPSHDHHDWEIKHRIEQRNLQIKQLQTTLWANQAAQLAFEQEVNRLKSEIDNQQARVNSLNSELSSTSSNLQHFIKEIAWAESESLLQLQVKLQEQETLLIPYAIRRGQLQEQILPHATKVSDLNFAISRLEQRIKVCTNKAAPFKDKNNLADLNVSLEQQKASKKPLSDDKSRLNREIDQENNSIRSAQAKISDFEHTLASHQATQFLINLRDNPGNLFDDLVGAVRDRFADYDYKFPAQQSYKVRAYLKNLEEDLQTIANISIPQKTGSSSLLDNPSCIKYLILCGYFQKMLDEVDDGKNDEFAGRIAGILLKHKVDSTLCKDIYAPYEITRISEAELNAYEQERFSKAHSDFSATLNSLPVADKNYKQLKELGLEIIKKVDDRKSNVKDLDIKYAALILENSNDLAKNPSDPIFQERQRCLANPVPKDKSAAKKRCWGILMMFLGAAAAIGSSLVVSVCPFAAGGISAGAVVLLAGIGLFRSGRKHLTQAMNDFEDKAEEIKGDDAPPAYTHEASAPLLLSK